VADLALHLAAVQVVLPDAVAFLCVAVRTAPCLGKVVAGADAFGGLGVHLPGTVAGDAVHAMLLGMHVTHAAFAEELVADARAMAARALVDGIGTLAEGMAGDEAAVGRRRAADGAAAAAGVARAAMLFPGRVHGMPCGRGGTLAQPGGEDRRGGVQGRPGRLRFLGVASPARFPRVVTGPRHHPGMGRLLVRSAVIARVAGRTPQAAMLRFQEFSRNQPCPRSNGSLQAPHRPFDQGGDSFS
jgi:hypothetical protein